MKNLLYGFEDYSLKQISPYYFSSANVRYSHFRPLIDKFDSYASRKWLVMSDNCETVKRLASYDFAVTAYNSPELTNKMVKLTPDMSLYFAKGCSVPKARCVKKYKIVTDPSKADAVVIPRLSRINIKYNHAVLVDENTRTAYIMQELIDSDANMRLLPDIGETFGKFHETWRPYIAACCLDNPDNVDALSLLEDAVCIWKGDIVMCATPQLAVFDTLGGMYDKIVFEDDIVYSLSGDENEAITYDTIKWLIDQLRSGDKKNVTLALNTLANMDYMANPTAAKYILCTTSWYWSSYRPHNVAIDTMMHTLKISGNSGMSIVFKNIQPGEFELASRLFIDYYSDMIANQIMTFTRYTNMTAEFSFKVSLSLLDSNGHKLENICDLSDKLLNRQDRD